MKYWSSQELVYISFHFYFHKPFANLATVWLYSDFKVRINVAIIRFKHGILLRPLL